MEAIGKILEEVIERAEEAHKDADDYIDDSGLLVCGKCHTRKQTEFQHPFRAEITRVNCNCDCKKQDIIRSDEEFRQQQRQFRIMELRKDGLTDSEYHNWTFDRDDGLQPGISNACQKYVEEWKRMREDNVGLLFFGGVGTGKSFYACCIANALLEKGVPSLVTNFPRILQKLQAGWGDGQTKLFDQLQKYELVVIDDLGVERSTEYALEQVYTIIDTRYRSGKPLIVTTNLSPADLKNPTNISYARIYDRILQNSIPVKMTGASRRTEIAAKKREKYQEFLGL